MLQRKVSSSEFSSQFRKCSILPRSLTFGNFNMGLIWKMHLFRIKRTARSCLNSFFQNSVDCYQNLICNEDSSQQLNWTVTYLTCEAHCLFLKQKWKVGSGVSSARVAASDHSLLYWSFFLQKVAPRMRCVVGESRVVVITLKWQWKTMEQPEAWWSAYISLNHFSSVEKKIVESGKTTSKLEVRNNHTSELSRVHLHLFTIHTWHWTSNSNVWLIIIVNVVFMWPNFFTIWPNFVPFLPVVKIYMATFWYHHCSKDLNTNSLKGKLY